MCVVAGGVAVQTRGGVNSEIVLLIQSPTLRPGESSRICNWASGLRSLPDSEPQTWPGCAFHGERSRRLPSSRFQLGADLTPR